MKTTPNARRNGAIAAKRMALYARVSTQEQTKGNYPSCDSQVEELQQYCQSRGWQVVEIVKDEGVSAGTLNRKGLSHVRWLVETQQIDGVICTWYDRLVRTRDFYILDKEFTTHDVEFITLHDPTDRNTASGRFLETMLVAAKTYEREQTGEKVRTKLRMRKEKGLWNGGLVPFGFLLEPKTQAMVPDEEKIPIVRQMFETYVESRSDFVVRDWLKAHQIAAPTGKAVWVAGSIRDLLMNRRYIGEIEINKDNQGRSDLPEFEAYRIVPAPHEALIPRELWEQAQAIRSEKVADSPNRRGRPRSYSQNQCNRVYLLQGNMVCGTCGHSMTPYYVCHKPNPKENRRTTSYIYRYACAQRIKYRRNCDHNNYVLARVAENWVTEKIAELATCPDVVETAVASVQARSEVTFQPAREALNLCAKALEENQGQIDELLQTASNANGALLELLSERANQLKLEREKLRQEQRRLKEELAPAQDQLDVGQLQSVLSHFEDVSQGLEPLKMQQLLRLLVRKIEWQQDGSHTVHYYGIASNGKNKKEDSDGIHQNPLSGRLVSGAKLDDGETASAGFEPATNRLTADRSTTELRGNIQRQWERISGK